MGKISKLYLQTFFLLLITTAIICAAVIILVWFNADLILPILFQSAKSTGNETILTITTTPSDTVILIDDLPFLDYQEISPGEHNIEISKDGYRSINEVVTVLPNQKNEMMFVLVSEKSLIRIADYAREPRWDGQGNLFFHNILENRIYTFNDGNLIPKAQIDGDLLQIQLLPSGTQAIILVSHGEYSGTDIQLLNLDSSTTETLFGPSYISLDFDTKTIWGINDDLENRTEKTIWSMTQGEEPIYYFLEESELLDWDNQIAVDANRKYLAIENSKGISLWDLTNSHRITDFPSAESPIWVQQPSSTLVFLEKNNLVEVKPETNWIPRTITDNIPRPITLSPDGTKIIFSRFNQVLGGSSFWSIDPSNASFHLVSEAESLTGRITQFSLSPDGSKLAFINQNHVLFLLTINH